MAAKQPAPSSERRDRPRGPRARWWLAIAGALLAGNYRDASTRTGPRALPPILRPSDRGRKCRRDHLEGERDPGDLQTTRTVQGLERDHPLRNRDSRIRRYRGARAFARPGRRRRQRAAAANAPAVVGEHPPQLRADAALSRLVDRALAQRRERAIAARLLRPFERATLRTGG